MEKTNPDTRHIIRDFPTFSFSPMGASGNRQAIYRLLQSKEDIQVT